MECDGYFEGTGIEFDPGYVDEMVHYVRSDETLTLREKKDLIICWFDTTYGNWNGSRYDLKNSRTEMSKFLKGTTYRTYEELLEDATNGRN